MGEQTFAAHVTLAHLYYDHFEKFEQQSGVEVAGAKDAKMNGWYRRKVCEDPPRDSWIKNNVKYWNGRKRHTGGRPWFEKNHPRVMATALKPNMSKIYWCSIWKQGQWLCADEDGTTRYYVRSEAGLPPAAGWKPVHVPCSACSGKGTVRCEKSECSSKPTLQLLRFVPHSCPEGCKKACPACRGVQEYANGTEFPAPELR